LKAIKVFLVSLFLLYGPGALTQDSKNNQLDKSLDISTSSINSGAANQERLNKIDDETRLLEFDYKDTIKEYENLKLYNDQLQRIINSQEEEIISILNQIDELDNININLIPIMLKMIDALDKFVSLDIPFLKSERTERVSNLKSIMDRGDISTSEKFRKVTEAYQIESDYGRTIEAYRSEVNFEGETFNADFLRVGRVSLAFVTSNGDKAGYWNKSSGSWEESSASVKRSTIEGLKIALKQAPPTLITIPLTSYENSN
tara:strand:+ start:6927 stop:7703 length:777 start_codon:yes stop_codon:yes gene_type:complete